MSHRSSKELIISHVQPGNDMKPYQCAKIYLFAVPENHKGGLEIKILSSGIVHVGTCIKNNSTSEIIEAIKVNLILILPLGAIHLISISHLTSATIPTIDQRHSLGHSYTNSSQWRGFAQKSDETSKAKSFRESRLRCKPSGLFFNLNSWLTCLRTTRKLFFISN